MARPKRDRWHLMDIAHDLAYEWWMAAESANRLDTLRLDENKRWETNTAFEAFLVHGRNLRDFFLESFNPDDVIVEDFLGSSISVEIPKLDSVAIDIWITKKVLHLSHSRLTLPHGWRHRHLMEEIDGAMRSFVAALQVTEEVVAGTGFLWAPVVITLADWLCACGTPLNMPKEAASFTTLELKTNFLGSAKSGQRVAGCARPVHVGRTTQVWDVAVTNESTGRTIALFRCTQMILYPRA